MTEMTTDEILGKLSEMSETVHSTLREMEKLDAKESSLDGARETLLASIQTENSQSLENESINWVLVSIITVALFIFAILMTLLIIYLQRNRSQNSEPAIQINA